MPESKKKILYIVTKSNFGGAQRYVFDLAASLKEGFEIVVASGGNGILLKKLADKGIRTISIPSMERNVGFFKEFKAISELLKIFRKENPDIVHLNSSKAGLIGSIAVKIFNKETNQQKIKTIFTVHGFPFEESRNIFWKGSIWIATWISMMLSDNIIVVSKKDEAIGKSMPFVSKKISYIPNGIAPFALLPKEEARKKLLGENFEGIVIGTIAELNKNKGLEYLLGAIPLIKEKNIKFVIIGEGEDRKKLEGIIHAKNLPVTLTGFIENASEYLSAFDIFVLPSLKEGLPYVLLEAGYAGLPTVASKVGGIPDIIQEGVSGTLITPKDVQALTKAIEKYVDNPEFREKHGKELQEIIAKNFILERMAKETLKTYGNI